MLRRRASIGAHDAMVAIATRSCGNTAGLTLPSMTHDALRPLSRSIPGFRLLWVPLALGLGAAALLVAWLIRPRGLAFDGDGFLSSAIGAIGLMVALSALPLASRSSDG